MLPKDKITALMKYWVDSSKNDLQDVESLYKNKRYSACLFWGHLLLEKILKALAVQETKKQAPRTHNLPLLAQLSKTVLTKEEYQLLFEVDAFNMETRYPDEQFTFHKKCTPSFSKTYYHKIISLYKKLCLRTR